MAMFLAGVVAVSSMAANLPMLTGPGNLVIWVDAGNSDSVIVDDSTGQVAQWKNLAEDSVFGITTFARHTSTGPTLATLPNDIPVIRFDGGNILRADAPMDEVRSAGTDWTFFFVLANMTDTKGLFDSGQGAPGPLRFHNNTNYVTMQDDDDKGAIGGIPVALPEDTSRGLIFSFSHGEVIDDENRACRVWDGFINGEGYEGSFASYEQRYTHVTWRNPQFGGINGNGVFYGDIAEVIIFQGVLNDTDRLAVETYLAGKYGIGIPEPATMTLLALGGLALLRRQSSSRRTRSS